MFFISCLACLAIVILLVFRLYCWLSKETFLMICSVVIVAVRIDLISIIFYTNACPSEHVGYYGI